MSQRTMLGRFVADRRVRRRFGLVTLGAWLVFSLAAGGGLVQYAPGGWIVPLHTWITYSQPTPYGFYALNAHWAVVPVPLYLAQALGVALLAGTYAGIAARSRRCRPERRTRGRVLGLTGSLAGILGAAACCSPLALLLAMLLGSSVAAALTGVGLWVAAGIFAVAITLEVRRLRAPTHATAAPTDQTTWPSASTATAPRPAQTGQDREVVSSSRS